MFEFKGYATIIVVSSKIMDVENITSKTYK